MCCLTADMASNYAPLTPVEKEQLRTQPNIDLILAWALVRGISQHPEVLEQIAIKQREVSKLYHIRQVLYEYHLFFIEIKHFSLLWYFYTNCLSDIISKVKSQKS